MLQNYFPAHSSVKVENENQPKLVFGQSEGEGYPSEQLMELELDYLIISVWIYGLTRVAA